MLHKVFKYRMYPTKEQEARLKESLETHRRLYNYFYLERYNAWKEYGRRISKFDQSKQVKDLRKENPYLAKESALSLHYTRDRVDQGFQSVYKKKPDELKSPKLHKRKDFNSVDYGKDGWKISGNRVHISKITCDNLYKTPTDGGMKVGFHRPMPKPPKAFSFTRDGGRWYALFMVEGLDEPEIRNTGKPAVGIDVGLKEFLVTSEGDTVSNPRFYKASEKKLRRLNRALARKQKGSENYYESIKHLNKHHAHVRNQRKDFQRKVARNLVDNHDLVAVEKLDIQGMTRSYLRKSVNDVAWYQFRTFLKEKGRELGVDVREVEPRNTTQNCSACGKKSEMHLDLSARVFRCSNCKSEIDRDHNAARNILVKALLQQNENVLAPSSA